MAAKKSYRVSNWSSYNRSLIERGSLTIWFNEAAIKKWNAIDKTGKRGRPGTYSDIAIETALSLRGHFQVAAAGDSGIGRFHDYVDESAFEKPGLQYALPSPTEPGGSTATHS